MLHNSLDRTIREIMIKHLALHYLNDGFEVKADIGGFEKPSLIEGRMPAITATRNDEKIVAEVVTAESMFLNEMRNLFKAVNELKDSEFHVMTPFSFLDEAKRNMQEWNVKVDFWYPYIGF